MGKKIGAHLIKNGRCQFRVWAPFSSAVSLLLKNRERPVLMERDNEGYWEVVLEGIQEGDQYKIKLNEEYEYPDPASRSQPEGVHSWSAVVADEIWWEDQAHKGREIGSMIIYELHVGTYTPEGTFEAIIGRLDHLEKLGVNTIELMPVAQFPGERNWGYDGVYPYATQKNYGGARGLKELVNACHKRGICVLLDVVYNHLGPEGNYLSEFGPYFTSKYHTPWGSAINLDDEYSDHVRNFFIQNALMWLEEFHLDGLRLDAVHELIDRGACHFLKALSQEVDRLEHSVKRYLVLIAESDLNDAKIVSRYEKGGYGLEGQWVDDFHHSLHTVLTGERAGYYEDFGSLQHLGKAFLQGFVYDGVYSRFRKRSIGNSPAGLSGNHFVVAIQNHDQVGNRLLGERLAELVSFEKQKLAAAVLLAAPHIPMLFMGEEFGATDRFQYFVSHGDPELVKAVQEGRKKEFEYFAKGKPSEEFPDPQAKGTFAHSKISWDFEKDSQKKLLFAFYRELIHLRTKGSFTAFGAPEAKAKSHEAQEVLEVKHEQKNYGLCGIFNFGKNLFESELPPRREMEIILASADAQWGGQKKIRQKNSKKLEVPADSVLIYKYK